MYRRPEITKILLEEVAINSGKIFLNGSNWLHVAALANDVRITQQMLNAGVDPDKVANEGSTPADFALDADSPDVFAMLLQAGGKLRKTLNAEFPPIFYVIRDGRSEKFFDLLFDNGYAELTAPHPDTMDPLQYSASYNNPFAVRQCLNRGSKLDRKFNFQGKRFTALDMAAWTGNEEIARMLLESGSKPGEFTAHFANFSGSVGTFEALASGGSNFRAVHSFDMVSGRNESLPRDGENDAGHGLYLRALIMELPPEKKLQTSEAEYSLSIIHDDVGSDAAILLASELSGLPVQLVEREHFFEIVSEREVEAGNGRNRNPKWMNATHLIHQESVASTEGKVVSQWKLVEVKSAQVLWIHYDWIESTVSQMPRLATALVERMHESPGDGLSVVLDDVRTPLAQDHERESQGVLWLIFEKRLMEERHFRLMDRQLLDLVGRESLFTQLPELLPSPSLRIRGTVEPSLTDTDQLGFHLAVEGVNGERLFHASHKAPQDDLIEWIGRSVESLSEVEANLSPTDGAGRKTDIDSLITEAERAYKNKIYTVAAQAADAAWTLGDHGRHADVARLRAAAHAEIVRSNSKHLHDLLKEYDFFVIPDHSSFDCTRHPMRPPGALTARQAIESTTAALDAFIEALEWVDAGMDGKSWEVWLEETGRVFDSVRATYNFIPTAADRILWRKRLASHRSQLFAAREKVRNWVRMTNSSERILDVEAVCATHAMWSHESDDHLLDDWAESISLVEGSSDVLRRAKILEGIRQPWGIHGWSRFPPVGYPRSAYMKWIEKNLQSDEPDVAFLASCLVPYAKGDAADFPRQYDRICRDLLRLVPHSAKSTKSWLLFDQWKFVVKKLSGRNGNHYTLVKRLGDENYDFHLFAFFKSFLSSAEDTALFDWGTMTLILPDTYHFLGRNAEATSEQLCYDYSRRSGAPLQRVESFSGYKIPAEIRRKEGLAEQSTPPPSIRTLEVDRIWHPLGSDYEPDWASQFHLSRAEPIAKEERFWIYGEWNEDEFNKSRIQGCVFAVHPASLNADAFLLPEAVGEFRDRVGLGVFEDILLVGSENSPLFCYDRRTGEWSQHDRFHPCLDDGCARVGNEVFFLVRVANDKSALIGLDVVSKKTRIVASSLRNPPESPLDLPELSLKRVNGSGDRVYVQSFNGENFIWHVFDPLKASWEVSPGVPMQPERWAVDFSGAIIPARLRGPSGSAPLSFLVSDDTGVLLNRSWQGRTLMDRLKEGRVFGNLVRQGNHVAIPAPSSMPVALWFVEVSALEGF